MEDRWSPCLHSLEGHEGRVFSARFSHDSTVIASACRDHTVKIWDASSGQRTITFDDYRDMVLSILFSHDYDQSAMRHDS
jgi:WD40 repeat protein